MIREQIRQWMETAPAFPALAAFAWGGAARLHGWGIWAVAAGMLLGTSLAWFCAPSRAWRLLLPVLTAAGFLRASAALARPDWMRWLPPGGSAAEVRLLVTETPFLPEELSHLDEGRGLVLAEIQAIRLPGERSFRQGGGQAALRPPRGGRDELRRFVPGETLTAEAALLPAPPPGEWHNGLFGDRLQARGIPCQCRLLRWHSRGPAPGLKPALLRLHRRLRGALARRLIAGCPHRQTAQLELALGLGLAEFLPADASRRQAASGTVHLFAVSGMHLGMMTFLAALLLRWLHAPLRLQWLGCAFLAGAYTILTGASPSGVRAMLMVWFAAYARLRFRPPSWLHTVGLAGLASLILHPTLLGDLGFRYSYLVVLSLILAAPRLRDHARLITERLPWTPRAFRPRRRLTLLAAATVSLEGCLTAWFAGCGIALASARRIHLAAPLLNLPLGILATLALFACPCRLLLGLILPSLDHIWSTLLAALLKPLGNLAEAGAGTALCLPVAAPPPWIVVLYQAAFALWLVHDAARHSRHNLRDA